MKTTFNFQLSTFKKLISRKVNHGKFALLVFTLLSFHSLIAQVKVFSGGNTTVGTLSEIDNIFRLQVESGSSPTIGRGSLYLKSVSHINDYQYCQINNVNRALSKGLEIQLNGVSKYYIRGDEVTVFLSDKNLKTNITDLPPSLEKILQLKPYSYQFIDELTTSNKLRFGFLAQEMEEILPALVDKENEKSLGINYIELIPFMVKSIHELNNKIIQLEAQLDQCCNNLQDRPKK